MFQSVASCRKSCSGSHSSVFRLFNTTSKEKRYEKPQRLLSGYEIEIINSTISEDEAKRTNIPADPVWVATREDRSTSSLEFFDDLLKRRDPSEEERSRLAAKRSEAERYRQEREAWEPLYREVIEYPASQVFIALKGGQLKATGRLLPVMDPDETYQLLEREDKGWDELPLSEIPPAFWSLSGIDFQSSTARNTSANYCHISCRTADVILLFPGTRKQVVGIEEVGDCFVLSESNPGAPPRHTMRGRPPYPWEHFHLEVTDLIKRGELPSKKEAAIQYFQTWFESHKGVCPSRAAIGEKLKPYYDKFGRRGGQKISE